MKRLKSSNQLICGLSSGDISILTLSSNTTESLQLKIIQEIKLAHDFGVNSIDAKMIGNKLCVVSGGDD